MTGAKGRPVPPKTVARGHVVPPVVRAAGLSFPAPVDAGPWAFPELEPGPGPGPEIESAPRQLEGERERAVLVGAPAGAAPESDGFLYVGTAEVAAEAGDLADPGDFSGSGEAGIRRDRASGGWRERAGAALRERMPVWVQTRCGLERRNVIALGVLLLVAAVFAVHHFWVGRTQPVRAPEVVRAAAPFGDGGGSAGESEGGAAGKGAGARASSVGARGAASAAGAAGAAGAEIVVDVSGKVREPGVHRLPAGSRVTDALRAAGGVRPGTNTEGLNRARFLVDGEQIVVGGPAPVAVPAAGGANIAGVAGSAAGAAPTAPVSLNTGTAEQLNTLPGVGPVLAQHIIDYRTQHGGFRSVDELRQVNGIGDRRFADLRDLVQP
ncbi:helix-hairpin-helix domain-containing protein [Streptomyces sp. NPDC059272]|uniref:helix-hairpin-helix domain-containing protein n=1 Tax=Streptomyces sp. NPDC059272 TaxID=3346800 RepID=UPI0036B4A2A0